MPGGFVAGRKFYSDTEYREACEDLEKIDELRAQTDMADLSSVSALYSAMQNGDIRFKTSVGRDFDDEIYELIAKLKKEKTEDPVPRENKSRSGRAHGNVKTKKEVSAPARRKNNPPDKHIEEEALKILHKDTIRRNIIIAVAAVVAVGSLGYFLIYSKSAYSSQQAYDELAALKGTEPVAEEIEQKPLYTLAEADEVPDILDEYKNIYIKNKSVVGWLSIEDTNIDYPVMQTVNNDYYLDHDFEGNEDNNGAIFMDYQCDPVFATTNYIIYGHHMKSGKMFGNLKKYEDADYCAAHSIIQFDTIYKKNTYQVMFVFKDKIKDGADVSFKYYQFLDASSEEEYDSDINSMREMSIVDTGLDTQYGDQLLILSTCNGSGSYERFVVVAKHIE